MNSLSEREKQRHESEQQLIANIATARDDLFRLLEEVNDHWGYEDAIYRFYHQSFKVFFLQASTEQILASLMSVAIKIENVSKLYRLDMVDRPAWL
jgi:uncharacterized protein YpmS